MKLPGINLVTLIAVVVQLGCSAALVGPKMIDIYPGLPRLAPSTARVTFIRDESKDIGWNLDIRVYVDGVRIVKLPNGGCFSEDVSAETHTLRVDVPNIYGGKHELEVEFEPESSRFYFIKARESAVNAGIFGVIGVAIESATAENSNNGFFEMIELSQEGALLQFDQCVYYSEESQ